MELDGSYPRVLCCMSRAVFYIRSPTSFQEVEANDYRYRRCVPVLVVPSGTCRDNTSYNFGLLPSTSLSIH